MEEGVPNFHVQFKKWVCHLTLSLHLPDVSCQVFKMSMLHVTVMSLSLYVACQIQEMSVLYRHSSCPMSNLKTDCVDGFILGVFRGP